MPLSKSSFKKYQQCAAYFWFDQNHPEVLAATALSDFEQMLADQGKKVEARFYSGYPELKHIQSKGIHAVKDTRKLVQQSATIIAQAAFEAEGFFAQSDMVHFKGDHHIDVYEIKSSSSMQNMDRIGDKQAPSKEDHITDLTFQYAVASMAGYTIDTAWLVELNKEYIYTRDADPTELFLIQNVTDEVLALLPDIRKAMHQALSYSTTVDAPVTCDCKYKARKKQCPAFSYLHPETNGYTVYDLPRIHETRLREFVNLNIIRIEDIPAKNKLTDIQRDHVQSWNENRELIRPQEIARTLNALAFPLYFLDYETSAPAIPHFDGTRPYQHIPFQYSLHIIHAPNTEAEHVQFLHTEPTSPVRPISEHLRKSIGDTGTIIVWHKTFESNRNKELSYAVAELADFLLGLNDRMFDLKDIFAQRMYVHKDFRGSNSIKDVLPVLVPHLSYKNLTIGDGGKATTEWSRMVFDITDEEEKETIRCQLLEYCKLDTLAMVEIYKKIVEKIRG